MTNPSKDTPKQPISTSPPNPPHCLLMLFEEQLSMYLKFKPQMFSSSPGQTTEKCLHIETLVQRQFCAISIWQDQFYGVVFSLFFFSFTFLLGHLIYCTLPLSNIKAQNVLHEVFFVVCLSGCVVVWGLFVWLFFFLLFAWFW